METPLIEPASESAGQLHTIVMETLRAASLGQAEHAKSLLAQVHKPLGELITQLGHLFLACLEKPLRFQIETEQYDPDTPDDGDHAGVPVPFTISLMQGIEITCGPLASVSRGDRPIIFIERHSTGRTVCVNSPDNGGPATVVSFHPDGSSTLDDIPWWNSLVKDLRNTPMCGIVQGDFVSGFHIVGPFRTQDDARASASHREGDLIVDFWRPGKPRAREPAPIQT